MSPQCQAAFEQLKQALYKEPIFQYPNTEKPYILVTDASHYAYCGLLTEAVESPGDLKPKVFMSGSFLETQQR